MPNKSSHGSARRTGSAKPAPSRSRVGLFAIVTLLTATCYLVYNDRTFGRLSFLVSHRSVNECRAPLPQFITKATTPDDHPALQAAATSLNKALEAWSTSGELDSIAVSVVASDTIVYEGYWGVLRANETVKSKRGTVDRHSIYRLASISKLFTAMETLILRDKGVLNL